MASFVKDGNRWRAFVFKRGVRKSKTFPTKARAQAWATVIESEILAGARGESIPRTVRAALIRYREEVSPTKAGARWETVRLKKLERELTFAGRLLEQVAASDVALWRDAALLTLKPASVRREMVLLRSVFERCRKEWGWLKVNPMGEIEWPSPGRPRDRRISADEIDRILLALNYERGSVAETASQVIAVAFLWALETAMRAGEILALTPADINASGRFCTVSNSKNGDTRDVALSIAALALLKCLPTGERLFPVADPTRDTLFRRATKAVKIKNLTFHDARHEAITRLARKLDVLDLARMIGHRDLKSLMVYFNPTATEIASRLG